MILPYTSSKQGWHVAYLNTTVYIASMNLKIRMNYRILAALVHKDSDLLTTLIVAHAASALDIVLQ